MASRNSTLGERRKWENKKWTNMAWRSTHSTSQNYEGTKFVQRRISWGSLRVGISNRYSTTKFSRTEIFDNSKWTFLRRVRWGWDELDDNGTINSTNFNDKSPTPLKTWQTHRENPTSEVSAKTMMHFYLPPTAHRNMLRFPGRVIAKIIVGQTDLYTFVNIDKLSMFLIILDHKLMKFIS